MSPTAGTRSTRMKICGLFGLKLANMSVGDGEMLLLFDKSTVETTGTRNIFFRLSDNVSSALFQFDELKM